MVIRSGNLVRTARPLPAPTPDYDAITAEVLRRTIEQNFEDLYAQVALLRGEPEREEALLSFEASLIQGHVVVQDDGSLADLDLGGYAQTAANETISGTWNFTSAPTIGGNTVVTAANLEAQLEALTTTELNMSGVDNLTIGDSLTFSSAATDWTIDGSGLELDFNWGPNTVAAFDPNSQRFFLNDASGNQTVDFYVLDTTPTMRITGGDVRILLQEDDAPADEGGVVMRMSNGRFQAFSITDAGVFGPELWLFNRNGSEWDFWEMNSPDLRVRTNEFAATDVNIYQRFYTKGGGAWHLERRNESAGTPMAWRFLSPGSGDFVLQNYNFGSLQDTWINGDVSTGEFEIAGNVVSLNPDTYVSVDAQIAQPGGMVGVAASGLYSVSWDLGWAFNISLTGNIIIDCDGAEARPSASYSLQVSNSSGASRTVTWLGVDAWNGTPPTTLDNNRIHFVRLHVVENLAGNAVRVIGEVLQTNITWT